MSTCKGIEADLTKQAENLLDTIRKLVAFPLLQSPDCENCKHLIQKAKFDCPAPADGGSENGVVSHDERLACGRGITNCEVCGIFGWCGPDCPAHGSGDECPEREEEGQEGE